MNRRLLLIGVLVLAVITSFGAAFPLTNVLLYGNADGWFTPSNLDDYGESLDKRLEPGDVVFTGHPAYVIESEDSELLFDRPRLHYFAVTYRGTPLGDRQYRRIAAALRNGTAEYAIGNDMTRNMLGWTGSAPARNAYLNNFCAVADPQTQRLYDRTNATLYRYVGNDYCPPGRRPTINASGR